MSIHLSSTSAQWLIETSHYSLEIPKDGITASLLGKNGRLWTNLRLLGSVNRLDSRDESAPDAGYLEGPMISEDEIVFEFWRPTSAWDQKVVILRCGLEDVGLSVRVYGEGKITDVTLGGGSAVFADGGAGMFRSSIEFNSLFVPTPTEPVSVVRPSSTPAKLGILGDATPGRLHGIFSPPPLVFGFGSPTPRLGADVPPEGPWLAAMLAAPVAQCTFTQFLYRPVDGGWLTELKYEDQTEVVGEWTSPELVFREVETAYDTVTAYQEVMAPELASSTETPAWWQGPIFCGWGAQCASLMLNTGPMLNEVDNLGEALSEGLQQLSYETESDRTTQGLIGPSTVASAAHLSTQVNYDRWLEKLAQYGINPTTVVLDDRWQLEYGTCTPDPEHWPNLKEWIRTQHHAGRKVLLWFKAWDPSGLPTSQCLTDFLGRPIAADPTNPEYLANLHQIITSMLSPEGLDADGLKIDFTQRAPSGANITKYGKSWGIAMLHTMLTTIHTAAKQAKPDALIINHTVNPLFADTADMIRLNDILEEDAEGNLVSVVEQMRFRQAVASRALPGHLIDTDQWPISNVQLWREYVEVQTELGVPALYYVDGIDGSGEYFSEDDLHLVARTWREYAAANQ